MQLSTPLSFPPAAQGGRRRTLATMAALLAAAAGVVIACGGCAAWTSRAAIAPPARAAVTSAGALSAEAPRAYATGAPAAGVHASSTNALGGEQDTPAEAPRTMLGALDAAVRAADRPASDARRRLQAFAPGTYIGELLDARDSALTRWPDRGDDAPLTVWVASGAGQPGWNDAYVDEVVGAFESWARLDLPVRFRFVADSASADVHVRWVDRFREPISGRTVWSRDEQWWMTDANITLALHHRDGAPLDTDQVRAITLHEVGHLLGLDHTVDGGNVMAARVRVRDLSDADVATARLLYSLPAGRIE